MYNRFLDWLEYESETKTTCQYVLDLTEETEETM